MKRFVLGIGGFIGSGKSTVARSFEKLGAYRIDADEVVARLYEPGAVGYQKILNFFGDDFMAKDGSLNRKKLAREVFDDPKKLRILHDLIHPLVTSEIQKLIDKSSNPLVVIEAIYFEKKYLQRLISALAWVETSKELAFKRITNVRNLAKISFEKIYRIQVKPENIDYVIVNNGSKKSLDIEVEKLFRSLSL